MTVEDFPHPGPALLRCAVRLDVAAAAAAAAAIRRKQHVQLADDSIRLWLKIGACGDLVRLAPVGKGERVARSRGTPGMTMRRFSTLHLALLAHFVLSPPWLIPCKSYYPAAFDVVTIALKPTCVNRQMITSVNTFMLPKPRSIHVVAARGCGVFRTFAENVVCYLVSEAVSEWLGGRFQVRSETDAKHIKRRSTWYFQQFLKLAVATHIPGLADYFLIFDSE
ncbi:hypothetical protein VOLCADRAFT_98577 [Volvox carteri f. nagariensis]|uniref:Uncharacterized protein n=1 Tax=Volvox carteri f. nagariensis TaxID=3068 RepID=D8UFQ4_VOLCA|nr:uncharacterized protein VOLCADRAFT_98577 [Volvox carteri f. nagariensis]EFJ41418.1 hypothetical protein VOLCADRAFT_98577 [Volvox carteri f. nagariensis]|eukprot:XP_002957524.1 hypothetical protein VOLCADRAFT_98577 [Volvox carteri f. nagariensis]